MCILRAGKMTKCITKYIKDMQLKSWAHIAR